VKIAILDDYQNVALKLADWSAGDRCVGRKAKTSDPLTTRCTAADV
jgi:hypothetical protein